MEKKLILVTSPARPAARPTWQRRLAKNLKHIVYLDKDTLIVLSKRLQGCRAAVMTATARFFQQNIRDY